MKRIYRIISGFFLLTALYFSAGAAVLTPAEALSRVRGEAGAPSKVKALDASGRLKLVYTGKDRVDRAAVYLFGESNGFMLVSASDAVPALLGYGDAGILSAKEINPTLEWWMKEYARQIEFAEENGYGTDADKTDGTKRRAADYDPIQPMLKTKWNQGKPYNYFCPQKDRETCVTGCVATAMAQVMKYYEWPPSGTGSKYYEWNGQTIGMDFSDVTFDWDNMLDEYSGSDTPKSRDAVATLMAAAGMSVEMDYSVDGSGAPALLAASAFVEYFRYKRGAVGHRRDYTDPTKWETIIYDNLKNYGPVLYAGQSDSGGHAFVVDGYSKNGLFHVNWGWGGYSDGYFLLSALTPEDDGIGGAGPGKGYNYEQEAICRLVPDKPGTPDLEVIPVMYCMDFRLRVPIKRGLIAFADAPIYSGVGSPELFTFGVKAQEQSGPVFYMDGSYSNTFELLHGVTGFSFSMPWSLPDGIYRLSPIVKIGDGDWYDLYPMNYEESTKTMTIIDGLAYFSDIDDSGREPDEGWRKAGKALITDNMLSSAFGFTAQASPIELELMENVFTPGVYKLKNALANTYNWLQIGGDTPDLIIDTRDPEEVLIAPQFTGLTANYQDQPTGPIVYFSDSWYNATYDYYLGPEPTYITMTEGADGKLTIDIPPCNLVVYMPYINEMIYGSTGFSSSIVLVKEDKNPEPLHSIEGDWIFTMGDYHLTESSGKALDMEYTATASNGEVRFDPREKGNYEIMAGYDRETGKLTFGFYYMGQENGLFLYQLPFIQDGNYNFQPMELWYDASRDIIAGDWSKGLAWGLYEDRDGQIFNSYRGAYNLLKVRRKQAATPEPPEENGIGTIFDASGFDGTPRYYNLQGLPVANPQPGQLLIKVEGGKSSKILFR